MDFNEVQQRHERFGLEVPDEQLHEMVLKPSLIILSLLPPLYGMVVLMRRVIFPTKVAVFPSGILVADSNIGVPDFLAWNEIDKISFGRVLSCQMEILLTTGVTWETELPLAFANREKLVDAIRKASGRSVKITVDTCLQ
jgi:hypothetical protein